MRGTFANAISIAFTSQAANVLDYSEVDLSTILNQTSQEKLWGADNAFIVGKIGEPAQRPPS